MLFNDIKRDHGKLLLRIFNEQFPTYCKYTFCADIDCVIYLIVIYKESIVKLQIKKRITSVQLKGIHLFQL